MPSRGDNAGKPLASCPGSREPCINEDIVQYLESWPEDDILSDRMSFALSRAIASLRRHPTRITSAAQAKREVPFIGDFLASRITVFLRGGVAAAPIPAPIRSRTTTCAGMPVASAARRARPRAQRRGLASAACSLPSLSANPELRHAGPRAAPASTPPSVLLDKGDEAGDVPPPHPAPCAARRQRGGAVPGVHDACSASEGPGLHQAGPRTSAGTVPAWIVDDGEQEGDVEEEGQRWPRANSAVGRGEVEETRSENAGSRKRKQKRPALKEYEPVHRSAPFALLIALSEAAERGVLSMSKSDLVDAAQPYADQPLLPQAGGLVGGVVRYSGWSSVGSTLVKKGLVTKYSNPARYALTLEGSQLARKLAERNRKVHARTVRHYDPDIRGAGRDVLAEDEVVVEISANGSGRGAGDAPSGFPSGLDVSQVGARLVEGGEAEEETYPRGCKRVMPSNGVEKWSKRRRKSAHVAAVVSGGCLGRTSPGQSGNAGSSSIEAASESEGAVPSIAPPHQRRRERGPELFDSARKVHRVVCEAAKDIGATEILPTRRPGRAESSMSKRSEQAVAVNVVEALIREGHTMKTCFSALYSVVEQSPDCCQSSKGLRTALLEVMACKSRVQKALGAAEETTLARSSTKEASICQYCFEPMDTALHTRMHIAKCKYRPPAGRSKEPRSMRDKSRPYVVGANVTAVPTASNGSSGATVDILAGGGGDSARRRPSLAMYSQEIAERPSGLAPRRAALALCDPLPCVQDVAAVVAEVVLVIDNREMKGVGVSRRCFVSSMEEAVANNPFPVEQRQLPVGDAVFVARALSDNKEFMLDCVIERKTVRDYVDSWEDGRLHRQTYAMNKSGMRSKVLLLEGKMRELDEVATDRQVSGEQLRRHLLDMSLCEGFHIQYTDNVSDTVEYLVSMQRVLARRYGCMVRARLEACAGSGAERRQREQYGAWAGRMSALARHMPLEQLFMLQLCSVPGVGSRRAQAVVDAGFRTVAQLYDGYMALADSPEEQANMLRRLKAAGRRRGDGGKVDGGVTLRRPVRALTRVQSESICRLLTCPEYDTHVVL